MNADYVDKFIRKIKYSISKEINKRNYNNALNLISISATILYQTNIRYFDNELEQSLKNISEKINIKKVEKRFLREDTILFWDGFGLNNRGLVQQYINALCKNKRVIYVTFEDREKEIPEILDILEQYNTETRFINRRAKGPLDLIYQLNEVLLDFKPTHFFFYSLPDDVVATTLLYSYDGFFNRYFINLTDHAFWLGSGCCDVYINFREYGVAISREYRQIEENKNVILPFYPLLLSEREFEGFPFRFESDKKIIFSGGAIYKTISEDNRFYKLVDSILEKYTDVIFWYAGNGRYKELNKLKKKYKKRVFQTEERSDFFQILKKCDIYLSTYPICGGLMLQYSALAGKVPLTLKYSDESKGFLINQDKLQIEFEDENSLLEEINKLLYDENYSKIRGDILKKSIFSKDVFEKELINIIDGERENSFESKDTKIDSERFQKLYTSRFSALDIYSMAIRKNVFLISIYYFPFEFFGGAIHIIWKKLIKQ